MGFIKTHRFNVIDAKGFKQVKFILEYGHDINDKLLSARELFKALEAFIADPARLLENAQEVL